MEKREYGGLIEGIVLGGIILLSLYTLLGDYNTLKARVEKLEQFQAEAIHAVRMQGVQLKRMEGKHNRVKGGE